jgi:KUP system potassium uptake protein
VADVVPESRAVTPPRTGPRPGRHHAGRAALAFGALGVVFGDIGTSPLYALQTVFNADDRAVKPTEADVLGVISIVVWTVTIIVSIEYLVLIMRADNDGEGGIMALIALVRGARRRLGAAGTSAVLVALGIFGASLFYGDGMITPAISVLSAVEGLEVATPSLKHLVVPIALVVLTFLFLIQRFGTGAVGRLFGPVMAVWFSVIALAGLREVAAHPSILRALSPTYGVAFFADHFGTAFIALGSIILTVTGAEALYADMGHFGRSPIRRAWFFAVFPALLLNYMGQGSLILRTPSAIDNPFFLLVPHWGRMGLVVLATAATVIASQAVISGAFSVTRQAVQLGFLPALTVRHTSAREIGQIYVPAVNWTIFVAVVALVVGFGSSQHLASAYGVAVTGTLSIDTILFFVVVRLLWRKPLWMALGGGAAFLAVDLTFLSANLTKILHGGWFPLCIALVVFTLLMTWQKGRGLIAERREAEEGLLPDFLRECRNIHPPLYRSPGTGVFLGPTARTVPLALRANVEHNHALHESVVIISIETKNVPHVPRDERIVVDDLGYTDDGILHLKAHYGFQDHPKVPEVLRQAAEMGVECPIDVEGASYFVSRASIVRGDAPGLSAWRKRLFITMARNAASPALRFGLPDERTVTMGSRIEL